MCSGYMSPYHFSERNFESIDDLLTDRLGLFYRIS